MKRRSGAGAGDGEYRKGYLDGMNAAFDNSELDAYYAGVGYAKKAHGDKRIGFNSDKERENFEAGMRNKDKHFKVYRSEPPTFLERLFFGDKVRKENPVGTYKKQRIAKTRKSLSKKRKSKKR